MPKQTSSYDSEAKTEGTKSGSQPSAEPPTGVAAVASSEGQPTSLPPAADAGSVGELGSSSPSIKPPTAGAGGGEGITAWQNDKRITALWSINENRNAWVHVAGVGWKKLSNINDSAIVALNMLGGSALQTQTQVNYRDEADGMIHEMYVW